MALIPEISNLTYIYSFAPIVGRLSNNRPRSTFTQFLWILGYSFNSLNTRMISLLQYDFLALYLVTGTLNVIFWRINLANWHGTMMKFPDTLRSFKMPCFVIADHLQNASHRKSWEIETFTKQILTKILFIVVYLIPRCIYMYIYFYKARKTINYLTTFPNIVHNSISINMQYPVPP